MTASTHTESFLDSCLRGATGNRNTMASAVFIPDMRMDNPRQEWQDQLTSLQQWVCELLIKNQQLRMALMEMKAKAPGTRE